MRTTFNIFFLTCALSAAAQDISTESYKYADETQLWRLTQNAAGLSLDSAEDRGVAAFDVSHRSGDFHRVQEGGMNNNLEFFTERYQKIGKYLYGYGSFKFDMGRTKQRAWSDVYRTYNSNPLISGSSVFGKYDNQDFELNASVASVPIGQLTFGANLFYKAGDLSRLRDPRSRVNLAEYRLAPAVTYSTGSHTFGLTANYDRRKEKLPGLNTVQTDPNLKYYVMTGLENATGTIGGYNGYMREYVDHQLGAELSYGYRSESFRSLNSGAFTHGTEYVYGTYKYQPGRYFHNSYSFATRNRLQTGALLHSLDAAVRYEEAYADEYRQERISVTDSITGFNSVSWNTVLEYRKRYQMKKTDLSFHYRCSVLGGSRSVVGGVTADAYFGFLADVTTVSNKRLLNTSELKYANTLAQIEGGISLAKRFWIEAKAGYNFANKADLSLADATTDYAQAVLLPDLEILNKDYFTGSAKLTLQLPITIEKKTRNWFVSAYGNYISAKGDLNRSQIGCSVGLYY